MLHVLLLILKIIGIVILAVLGLLLAVVLLVMLVPLRYRLQGSYHGTPQGNVRVTWLFHAVSVLVTYDSGLEITVKLAGFRIVHIRTGEEAPDGGYEDEWDSAGEEEPETSAWETGTEETGAENAGSVTDKAADVPAEPDGDEPEETGPEDENEPVSAMSAGENSFETAPEDEAWQIPAAGEDIASFPTIEEAEQAAEASAEDGTEEKREPDENESGDILDKIDRLLEAAESKLGWADEKRRYIMHFLSVPRNQKTLRMIWKQAKGIICHLLPRKAQGQVTFGFEDPATTGQVLAACSVLFALYGPKMTVTPVFEEPVLELDLKLSGRIRLGALTARAIRILIDRNLWRMIKQVRKFLENGGK